MTILEGSDAVAEAERAFTQAMEACQQAKQLDVRSEEYRGAITKVIRLCQEAISLDAQHDGAHVLLANALYRLHLLIYPHRGRDLPLKMAASVIQHWSDQPIRQHRSAASVENGCRVYDAIAGEISEILPECAEREEMEMRFLEGELYKRALVTDPTEWMAA